MIPLADLPKVPVADCQLPLEVESPGHLHIGVICVIIHINVPRVTIIIMYGLQHDHQDARPLTWPVTSRPYQRTGCWWSRAPRRTPTGGWVGQALGISS